MSNKTDDVNLNEFKKNMIDNISIQLKSIIDELEPENSDKSKKLRKCAYIGLPLSLLFFIPIGIFIYVYSIFDIYHTIFFSFLKYLGIFIIIASLIAFIIFVILWKLSKKTSIFNEKLILKLKPKVSNLIFTLNQYGIGDLTEIAGIIEETFENLMNYYFDWTELIHAPRKPWWKTKCDKAWEKFSIEEEKFKRIIKTLLETVHSI
ncbi:hypothetical protein ACUZ9N_01465 [Mycoplasmopsis gallinarum]